MREVAGTCHSAPDPDLGPRKARFVVLLIEGRSVEAAGAEVGVSSRTASRWWAQAEVRGGYRAGVRRSIEAAIAQVARAAGKATSTLEDAMNSGPPACRVRAAEIILRTAERFVNMDAEDRITRLEEAIAGEET